MTDKELLRALRNAAIDQHRCFGCGYEQDCGIHGCRIINAAAERIEKLLAERDHLVGSLAEQTSECERSRTDGEE